MAFIKGNKITFEYDKSLTKPRWDLGTDCGSSGKYGEGIVLENDSSEFLTQYKDLNNGTVLKWRFRYADSHQPGFPKIVLTEEEKQSAEALKRWMNL
jgi:hypothetical protein